MTNNLFLAHTPYNALLAFGYAVAKHAGESNTLVVLDNFGDAESFTSALRDVSGSPFQQVTLLPYTTFTASASTKRSARKTASRSIESIVRKSIWANVIAGSTELPFSHALMVTKQRSPLANRLLLEEGFSAYLENSRSKVPAWRVPIKKIQYGRAWNAPFSTGHYPWANAAHLHMPELANSWLKNLPLYKLDENLLSQPECIALARQLMPNYLPADEAVLVLEKHALLKNSQRYIQHHQALVKTLHHRGYRVVCKYHPRDPEAGYLGITAETAGGKASQIATGLPIELLLILGTSHKQVVVGEFSTALATARFINPRAQCISLQVSGRERSLLMPIFSKLGIQRIFDSNDATAIIEPLAASFDN